MPSFLSDILGSAEIQAFASGFPVLVLHAAASLALLAMGAAVYGLLSPWKEIALIREGNGAANLMFGGVVLGLAIPLAVSMSASNGLKDILIWGAAAVVLQLLAFRIVDLLLAGLPERMREGDVAAAGLLAAARLGTALILAAALTG